MTITTWLSLTELRTRFPALGSASRSTMLRRLHSLDRQVGGVLRRVGGPGRRGKLEVCLDALERALRSDPELRDVEVTGMVGRQDEFDRKLLALRSAHRSLKQRVKVLEDKQPN